MPQTSYMTIRHAKGALRGCSLVSLRRVHAGRTLHDVPASFLTYHSLSTPLQGPERVPASLPRGQQGGGMLPVGSNTAGETGHDELQVHMLLSAADCTAGHACFLAE